MSKPQEISVTMRDTRNNKEVVREIDITNFTVCGGPHVMSSPEEQREILLEWIEDRANDQHDTELALVSWYIIRY